MKKIAYLIILITMTFALVACGGGASTPEAPEEPAAAEEEAVEPESPEEPEVEEPEAEAVEPPPEEEAAEEEAVAVQPPPMDDPSLMLPEQFQMYVDDLPVEGWGKTLAAGAALDPTEGPSNSGFPPFVFIDFSSPGDELFSPIPRPSSPWMCPRAASSPSRPYLAMYDEGGRDYAQDAVSSLQQILDDRPATLDEKLLTLPGFGDAQQGVRGEPTYIDFPGGSGVGFRGRLWPRNWPAVERYVGLPVRGLD